MRLNRLKYTPPLLNMLAEHVGYIRTHNIITYKKEDFRLKREFFRLRFRVIFVCKHLKMTKIIYRNAGLVVFKELSFDDL